LAHLLETASASTQMRRTNSARFSQRRLDLASVGLVEIEDEIAESGHCPKCTLAVGLVGDADRVAKVRSNWPAMCRFEAWLR